MLSAAGTTLFIQVKASSSEQFGFCSATTTTLSSRSTVMEKTAILKVRREGGREEGGEGKGGGTEGRGGREGERE